MFSPQLFKTTSEVTLPIVHIIIRLELSHDRIKSLKNLTHNGFRSFEYAFFFLVERRSRFLVRLTGAVHTLLCPL